MTDFKWFLLEKVPKKYTISMERLNKHVNFEHTHTHYLLTLVLHIKPELITTKVTPTCNTHKKSNIKWIMNVNVC